MRLGFGLWIALACSYGCSNRIEKASREQCGRAADHIAEVIVAHDKAHPDELWDLITAESGDTGLPKDVTKRTFKAYLDTDQGATWMMQRQGQSRAQMEQVIDECVKATPKHVDCLLASKSKDDVTACDKVD